MRTNQRLKTATVPGASIEEGEFFRLLYEHSVDAILLTAPDGKVLAANPAACEMFGRSEDELKTIGREGVVDVSDQRLAHILKKRNETGHAKGELTGLRRDGTKFPMELSSSIFMGHKGELRTSMIIRDISERSRLEIQIRENNERLRNLIENLPDTIYTLNLAKHQVTSFNRESFLGYTYDELTASGSIQKHIHPDDAASVAAYWQKAIKEDAQESIEYRVRNKEGEWEWVDSRNTFMSRYPDGTPKEIMVILRVITDRKKADDQIAYHAMLLENVNDVIVGTDENFIITYWNPAAERTFGWKPEEVIGKNTAEVLRTTYNEGGREEAIREINNAGIWKGEVTQYTRDGVPVPIDANIMTIKDQAGRVTGYVSANRDISKRKQVEAKLLQAKEIIEAANLDLQKALSREQILARTDGLTGIFNWRHFFSLAEHEFSVAERYQSPISVIIFDIDHFKLVNDRWGHQVGDVVLRHVSHIAREQVRTADILARYGGEEFIVLLPNSNAGEAVHVAERIRENVMKYRIDAENMQGGITVSVGIAEKNRQTESLDGLIRCADQALYAAKKAGRNCITVYATNDPHRGDSEGG